MNFKFIFFWVIGCPVILLGSANSFQEMLESFEVRERMISEELKNNLENSSLYSSRGDMNLFLGRFEQARRQEHQRNLWMMTVLMSLTQHLSHLSGQAVRELYRHCILDDGLR